MDRKAGKRGLPDSSGIIDHASRGKLNRVAFERGHAVQTFTIHGTWRRACTMHDVPETGARLSIEDSIQVRV